MEYAGASRPGAGGYYDGGGLQPATMDRNIHEWPGETAATLGSTSTMELLHGPSLMSEPNSGKAPKQKRNRSALSCAECRRLKLRCSREPWPCSNCVKRKCAEVCPDDVLKEIRPSRNKEVGALQDRIRELEAQVAQLSASQDHSVPPTAHDSYFAPSNQSYEYNAPGPSMPLESPFQNDRIASLAGPSSRPASIKDDPQPSASDVAEVMGTLLLGDDGSSRYLGKSAANALFHDDGSDDDDGASIGSEEEEEIANNLSIRLQGTSFPMVSRGLEAEDFQAMLPPISEARYLAEQYYTNSAYMFEPLKRDVFEKHLRDAYDHGTDPPLPLEQLALVFTVLALGVSFDLSTDIRDVRSAKYHTIAQACLTSARFLNVPSLASIQCLLLMSTWQLVTHSQTGAFRSWPLLGLAGRMVVSTGIHRDPSIWSIGEPHLTIRRNLFWEIVSYDRMQSLVLGRPYQLNSKHWDTIMPEPGPGENIEGQSLEFHRAKWSFAMLVGDLCDDCLSVGRPPYDTILLYDRRIRAFKASLPDWLAYDPNREPGPGNTASMTPDARRQQYQRHHMTVMINETLLFLHRVAFANAIEHYPTEPLRSPWSQSVVSLCLEACRTLISVAKSAAEHYPKLAARWWHVQAHAFGAGVCLAAVCIKAPGSALIRVAWSELNESMNLLEKLGKEAGHAKDLHPRLKRLRDQAQAKLEAFQNSPSTSLSPHSHAGMDTSSASSGAHGQARQMGPGAARDAGPDGEKGAVAVKEEEGDQLAVLGAATRKLEGNFVQRHQPASSKKDGAGHGRQHQGDRDREQTAHSSSSGAGRSREATDMPVDSMTSHATTVGPLRGAATMQQQIPSNKAGFTTSRTIEHNAVQIPQGASLPPHQQILQQTAFPQTNIASGMIQQAPIAILPNPSSYIQRYDEIDPGLADVLNSISESPDLQGQEPGYATAEDEQGAMMAMTGQSGPSYSGSPVHPFGRMDQEALIGQSSLSKASALTRSQQGQVQYAEAEASSRLRDMRASTLQNTVYAEPGRFQQHQQQQQMQEPPMPRTIDAARASYGSPQQVLAGPSSPAYPAGNWRQSYPTIAVPRQQHAYQMPASLDSQAVQAGASSGSSPSQFSSPGHEYFERHPSASATMPFASLPQPPRGQRSVQGHASTDSQQYMAADERNRGVVPQTGPAGANGYLDSAWMDYFPTPGVGLFQQAPAPPTPAALYVGAGPVPQMPSIDPQEAYEQSPAPYAAAPPSGTAYFQPGQQAYSAGPPQGRYYGIEQQMAGQPAEMPQQQYRSSYAR